jgi:hypothetical protein
MFTRSKKVLFEFGFKFHKLKVKYANNLPYVQICGNVFLLTKGGGSTDIGGSYCHNKWLPKNFEGFEIFPLDKPKDT